MPSIKELKDRIGLVHSFFWMNLFPLSQLPIPGRHLIPFACLLGIFYLKYDTVGNSWVFVHWGISP